jgi:hypothetical protein
MRIDLSYVGGKLRPKRHRPIQTPVPAFLRCTQNRSAFAREPLTQPTREVWDRQRAIGGFPMTMARPNWTSARALGASGAARESASAYRREGDVRADAEAPL